MIAHSAAARGLSAAALKGGALILGIGLLGLLPRREARAAGVSGLSVSAPWGSVVTATVSIGNWGQPATTARLYEAWEPSATVSAHASNPRPRLRVPLPDVSGPISAELVDQLATAPDGRADMLIYLADQADLRAAASIPDWNERGAAVVETLTAHAVKTQQPLLAALRAAGHNPRSYWIVNALAVRGDRALADWLAAQAGVALVSANTVHMLEDLPLVPLAPASVDEAAWGVARINAPEVWANWDVRGQGIIVATIDTGVAYSHTALLSAYRGWSPQDLTHDYNWYDPASPKSPGPAPFDPQGHGTHTLGTIVGGMTAEAGAIGVAPSARWITARGCDSLFCDDESLLASAQWMLAPTDRQLANPRPDLRPHVISSSWGKMGDDPWYVGYVEAWRAAGIFSVFAGGNSALFGCGSSHSPGNYPSTFAAGATDAEDFIADFSSLGPTSDGRIKPDLSAPGVAVPSTAPDGSVVNKSGTSMATPHIAGAVALLWSANPTLIGDIEATRSALTITAVPRTSTECGDAPDAVPNNVYGWGRLDALQAVRSVRVDVPWLSLPPEVTLPANDTGEVVATFDARQVSAPGQYTARILLVRNNAIIPIPVTFDVQASPDAVRLTGHLQDRWSGAGVYGRLQLEGGPPVSTDVGGAYTVTLPAGTYPLTATATGYLSDFAMVAIEADTLHDVTLTADLPHLQMSTPILSATLPFGAQQNTVLTLSNDGPRPLTVVVTVPPLEWSTQADPPGVTLYDMSAFPPLPLADDMIYTNTLELGFTVPIYGAQVDRLYLSSNGWVSAVRPSSAQPSGRCLPSDHLPAGALVPFWTDLDPSAGGAVRAGRVSGDTFVVSFENVPPWRDPPDPSGLTYTFQLVLHSDGRVRFLYGAMGSLPARWGVGVSHDAVRGQSLACYRAPASLAGQGWTLRNQPPPALWLGGAPEALTVPPGGSASLTAALRGLGYVPWRAEQFVAVLRLTTNDPAWPVVDIPAALSVGAPPYSVWLPIVRR